jgi:hypothetical protein
VDQTLSNVLNSVSISFVYSKCFNSMDEGSARPLIYTHTHTDTNIYFHIPIRIGLGAAIAVFKTVWPPELVCVIRPIHPSIHPFIHPSIYGSTALCWALAAFSVSWSFCTVGRTPWTGDQCIARPLPTHRTTQRQNKLTQTSMSQMGLEPTIPVSERAKTVYAL